jgi:hypothetical protein
MIYPLVSSNMATSNPRTKWRFIKLGKSIIYINKWKIFQQATSDDRRLNHGIVVAKSGRSLSEPFQTSTWTMFPGNHDCIILYIHPLEANLHQYFFPRDSCNPCPSGQGSYCCTKIGDPQKEKGKIGFRAVKQSEMKRTFRDSRSSNGDIPLLPCPPIREMIPFPSIDFKPAHRLLSHQMSWMVGVFNPSSKHPPIIFWG